MVEDNAMSLEEVWENILSRQADLIVDVFRKLDQESQANVISHLQTMATEEGWHPEQVKSAAIALNALEKHS